MMNTKLIVYRRYSVIISLCVGMAILLSPFISSAQSSGPNIDECSSAVVDTYFGVEQTICAAGSISGITFTNEVDNYAYSGPMDTSPAAMVGAQSYILIGSTVKAASPDYEDNQDSGYSDVQVNITGFVPQLNVTYTFLGLYDECQEPNRDTDPDDCSWSTGYTGLQLQAEVTTAMTLSVASSGSPSVYSSPVTFTASISSGPTSGSIVFYGGGSVMGSGTINGTSARFTTNTLPPGSTTVYAGWAGNSTYSATNSSSIQQQVVPATPTLTVVSSNTSVTYGTSVTFEGGFANGPTNGTVTFYDSGTAIGTGTINGAIATYSTSSLAVGSHVISVSWAGDANYNGTSSSSITQNITQPMSTPGANTAVVYSYSITGGGSIANGLVVPGNTSGYDANGNIISYVDSVNGAWNGFTYDSLNRLSGGQQTPVSGAPRSFCWSYDSFGNRLLEATSATAFGAACANTGTANSSSATYTASNQITGLVYDAAGDITFDGVNSYAYDGDGRMCATATRPASGGVVAYQYLYDAHGDRVAKGTIQLVTVNGQPTLSCDMTQNGFTPTNSYVLGQGGEQVTEMTVVAGQSVWAHTNVYTAGMLLGTYDPQGLHFQVTDWLGNRRVQTNAFGQVEESCVNAPFGDNLQCGFPSTAPSTADDATEQHFTGKERDQETGNDYFGARYFGSNSGRFLQPDWSATAEPVPYAKLDDPQSLNLYAYVQNNPIVATDPSGHWLFNQLHSSAEQHEIAYEMTVDATAEQAKAQQQGASVDDKRNAIGSKAASLKGSTKWSYDAAPCGWKCNVFVHDVLRLVGIGGNGEPNAGQLADPNHHMSGWSDATDGDRAQLHVGDIVAYAYAPGTRSVASGDSGIISAISNDGFVSVTAAGQKSVYTESLTKWRAGSNLPDRAFMVRTYVGP